MKKENEIVELGRATRFIAGGRNCPIAAQQKASPPWSVKRAILRLMKAEFSIDEIPVTEQRLRRVFCPQGRYLTGAQHLAVKLSLAALSGNISAMQRLERITDGPVQTSDQVEKERQFSEY